MIVEAVIKQDILDLINEINSGDATQKQAEQVLDDYSTGLAQIIAKAIKQASVNVTIPPGTVSQGVSPTVVVNPVPIPLTGSLS